MVTINTQEAIATTSQTTIPATTLQLIGYGLTAVGSFAIGRGWVSATAFGQISAEVIALVPALVAAYKTHTIKSALIGIISGKLQGAFK